MSARTVMWMVEHRFEDGSVRKTPVCIGDNREILVGDFVLSLGPHEARDLADALIKAAHAVEEQEPER